MRRSLPVALTSAGAHDKFKAALRAARGHRLDSDADIDRLLATLPFATAGTYGGHTSCVQIETHSFDAFLCDMGTGLRPCNQALLANGEGFSTTFHIILSHLHWDHIMGLPFFTPAFDPHSRLAQGLAELEGDAAARPIGHLGLPLVYRMASASHYEHAHGWNRLRLVLPRRS